MKRKFVATCAATLFTLPLFGIGTALANTGYSASGDTTLNISESLLSTPTVPTGNILFTAQESLYQLTGTSVQHDYLWIDVNGSAIAAIDPPKVCF